ncbi:helix-turn-helix domain-containing protein [Alteripontixanthobacter maritimus]
MRPPKLKDAVAKTFGLTSADIDGPCRRASHTHPRSVITRILRERHWSFPQIGRMIGGRDHSTVFNSYHNFEKYAAVNPRVQMAYDRFKDRAPEVDT